MSRAQSIVVTSVLILIAVLALIVVVSQTTMTWYMAPDATGVATEQVAVFEPAVVGTVVTALAVVALLGHLLVVARWTAARWMWIVAVVVSIIAVVAAVVVSTADRPVF